MGVVVTSSTQSGLAAAAHHLESGRLLEAEQICRRILALNPGQSDCLHMLGLIAYRGGRTQDAIAQINLAIAARPQNASYHFNLALALTQAGAPERAMQSYGTAITLKPDYAKAHVNLGNLQRDAQALDKAEQNYRRAVALKSDYAAAHANLGTVLRELGRMEDALASYARAVALDPQDAESHKNMGNIHLQRGEQDLALARYRRAVQSSPDFAQGHFCLGNLLQQTGQLEKAEESLRRGLTIKPDAPEALAELAMLLLQSGRASQAEGLIRKSLALQESDAGKQAFVSCVRDHGWTGDDGPAWMLRALRENWDRPADLAFPAARAVRQGPQNMWLASPVLKTLLCCAPNADIPMERYLTGMRRELLDKAEAGADGDVEFFSALARQCFINEYVFAQSNDEVARAQALRAKLEAGDNAPMTLLAVAAFMPLGQVARDLLTQEWPEPVQAVLHQQIAEPAEEKRLRADIARLTVIADAVSQAVQSQYEENPYPRWVGCAPVRPEENLAALMHRKFPYGVEKPVAPSKPDAILIAGCGTGQHSLETALRFADAQILAIDLSLGSLGYAARKAAERGIANVTYAQADIMELQRLTQRFDLIESVGVLHHLGDPFAGWKNLVGLLAPRGFMRLGFYSEIARQSIVKARDFVAGHDGSAGAIRQARQEMMASAQWEGDAILQTPDFFSTSNCRDLIFHAQEHRMTLPQIGEFLKENDLTFLGFDVADDIRNAYRRRFPADTNATDLAGWDAFEKDNPAIFAAMYQFWVRGP